MNWPELLLWSVSVGGLGAMLVVLAYNLRRAPRLENAGTPLARPRVSLLVPARNELENLQRNLPALLASDWPDLQVLVLDDGSADGSADWLWWRARKEPRLQALTGRPLPAGWLGKNWACRQLADAADGEILIFCDADVTAGPQAVHRTVAALQRHGATALSALPAQRTGSILERALVPLIMQLPILGLLPLDRVLRSRRRSLLVANGQWFAFRRRAYEAVGGHGAVADRVLEDMALGRALKDQGLGLLTVLATRDLVVRMYRSDRDLLAGFGKNLAGLVAWRPLALAGVVAGIALTQVLPWLLAALGRPAWLVPLLLLTVLRLGAAKLAARPAADLLWHPLGSLVLPLLAIRSLWGRRRGRIAWKGRSLPPPARRQAA